MNDVVLTGGRYGLGSKDTPPSSVFAVYTELEKDAPKPRFTIGITDDVTNLSLPEVKPAPITSAPGTKECKFWGLGGDGTVGANKNSTKIIGDHTDKYIQAYFQYDSKKTGGVTISHLRFGDKPIRSPYYINQADFVACHNPAYIHMGMKMVQDVKPGGVFMINCQWTDEELDEHLNAAEQEVHCRQQHPAVHHQRHRQGYRDRHGQAHQHHPAVCLLQAGRRHAHRRRRRVHEGRRQEELRQEGRRCCPDELEGHRRRPGRCPSRSRSPPPGPTPLPIRLPKALNGDPRLWSSRSATSWSPSPRMDGDSLPVSAFEDNVDGEFEQGASAYEKRGTAVTVPEWDAEKCIQCNQCAFVCSHATIRPFCLTADEAASAPACTKMADTKPKASEYKFTMAVSPLDCMGCGECVTVCPHCKAIEMKPQESQSAQQAVFDYCVENIRKKDNVPGVVSEVSVKGSQFNQPLLEFSGSCAGCAETSYARLITQLFGEQMFISNATGCSSIWGGTGCYQLRTPPTKSLATAPPGSTPCSRTTLSTAWACRSVTKTVRANLITKVEALKGKNAEPGCCHRQASWTPRTTPRPTTLPAKALVAALEA